MLKHFNTLQGIYIIVQNHSACGTSTICVYSLKFKEHEMYIYVVTKTCIIEIIFSIFRKFIFYNVNEE